jgi:hypothetical protein
VNIIWPGLKLSLGLGDTDAVRQQKASFARLCVLRVEGETAMGAIMIRCPATNELIPVGIDADRDTFGGLPDVKAAPVDCPACGGKHSWSKKDAILEQTMRIRSRSYD